MKRIINIVLLLLPFMAMGQGLSEAQSRQRINQLQQLLQHYDIHRVSNFVFYPDCNLAVVTDSTDWQALVALDGTELLPFKYVFYRQIVDERYSPFFLVLSRDKMGLVDTGAQWVVPMECEHDGTCTAGCYAPYMRHWLEEGQSCLKSFKRRHLRELNKEGWMPVERPENSASRPTISGPYESLVPIADDLFEFFTGNPGDRGDHIFGYVDPYGNTTATPSQLSTMEKWLSGVIEYDVEPISVTAVVPFEDAKSSYTVFSCMSDTQTIGYLLVPWEDSASMALFNKGVSEDLWGEPVGISQKRYIATITDVQQTEALLAELMKDDILPLFGRHRRYIGNPDNYTKYFRTYGFYYNEEGERCVYVEMDLEGVPSRYVGFSRMWDACDAVVYLNLNLDTRKVIRVYQSSCQSY